MNTSESTLSPYPVTHDAGACCAGSPALIANPAGTGDRPFTLLHIAGLPVGAPVVADTPALFRVRISYRPC